MQARDLPLEYKRVFCKNVLEFWHTTKQIKSAGHRTSHLDCVWSKSIGFIDHDDKTWFGLSLVEIYPSDWDCPENENLDKWEYFVATVKTWQGRDKLFGVYVDA